MSSAAEAEDVPRRRAPGRPRDVSADAAIIQATLEILYRRGYAGLTVDDVAARAGVARTTVYRRWPSKEVLVAAAVSDRAAATFTTPDTGSTRGDLEELVRLATASFTGTTGVIMRALVRESGQSELLRALVQGIVTSRRELYHEVLDRAVARGDLPTDLDRDLFIDLLMGPGWIRLVVTESPIPEDLPARIVDAVLHGVLPH